MPSPAQIAKQIASDYTFALDLARQEHLDAGLSKGAPASDEAVVRSQRIRYAALQKAAKWAPAHDLKDTEAAPQPRTKRSRHPSPGPAAPQPRAAKRPRLKPPALPTGLGRAQSLRPPAILAPSRAALEAKLRDRTDMLEALPPHAQLGQVRGDGNCGYYALIAGLVRVAIDQVRRGRPAKVTAAFRALPEAVDDATQPACARGRSVLTRYADLIDAGEGEQVLAEMQSNFDDVHAAHMALRSARAHMEDEKACGLSRSGEFADSGDLLSLALRHGASLRVYGADRAAHDAEGAMHAVPLTDAGQDANTVEILFRDRHYDLLLPNG